MPIQYRADGGKGCDGHSQSTIVLTFRKLSVWVSFTHQMGMGIGPWRAVGLDLLNKDVGISRLSLFIL